MGQLNRPSTEPNITPLCDAALTLIVIFMMTLPAMLWSGIDIHATKAVHRKEPLVTEAFVKQISISLTEEKTYVGGKEIPSERLKEYLEEMLTTMENKTVIVISDPGVLFGRVVEAFDIAKQAGADRLALLKKKKR